MKTLDERNKDDEKQQFFNQHSAQAQAVMWSVSTRFLSKARLL